MKHSQILVAILSLIFFIIVGCTPQAAATATPTAPESVSIQLSWFHEYSLAPFHVAVREGFFSKHNLDVTLAEGGFNDTGYIEPIAEVVDGSVDFGLASSASLIQARANGQEVVAVANVLQRNPVALMTIGENPVQNPQDLVGRTIMVADGGARASLESLLLQQDIDTDSVTIIPRTEFGIDPLLNNEVDVLVAWIINEGVALEEAGHTPSFILMTDYGVDEYDFVLFTSDTMIETKPEVVRGVVDALRESLAFIVSNPEQAIEDTLSFNPELDESAQLKRLEATIPLMNVPGIPLGTMTPEVWQFSYSLLRNQGVVPEDFDVSTVYTLDFVPADSE